MNRLFFFPDFHRYVLLETEVLQALYAHAQQFPGSKEAGGELYTADPHSPGLVIRTASGPNPSDHRSRHRFNPDLASAARDRDEQFRRGLHAVGLWHTHPESQPRPSRLDREATLAYLRGFNGDRARYLMVIMGNAGDPPEVVVCSAEANSECQWIELCEVPERELYGEGVLWIG